MIFFKDEAIVLRINYVGSNDLSVTVYLKSLGKENIYVKGGQILKNLYLPKLQVMNWIKGVFINYKEKIFIKDIDKNVNMAYSFAKDIEKLNTAYWILSIFDKYTIFPDEKLFILLKSTLYNLHRLENKNLESFKAMFLIKYIALYGILPSINKCVKCGSKINSGNFSYFSLKESGSICKNCETKGKSDFSYDELAKLTKMLKSKFKDIKWGEVKISPSTTKKLKSYLENS